MYKTLRFHNKLNLRHTTRRMSHDKSKKHTYHKSTCYTVQACSVQFEVDVLWLVPAQSWGWRRFWHLLSSAGNTCLSSQSLVPVITFRCHSCFPLRLSQFLGDGQD